MEDDLNKKMEDNLKKKWKTNQSSKINLIGCDTIVNSPSSVTINIIESMVAVLQLWLQQNPKFSVLGAGYKDKVKCKMSHLSLQLSLLNLHYLD